MTLRAGAPHGPRSSRDARVARTPDPMRLNVVKRICDIIRIGVDITIRRVSDSFSECHFAVATFRVSVYIIEAFVSYF